MSMTKKEITDLIYDHMGISRNECAQLIDSFFDIIKEELIQGKDVKISGFGRWSVRKKRARTGRNPQTGKAMTISARTVVTFKWSHKVWEKLNGKEI
jgi:integration host factor subunit alpha